MEEKFDLIILGGGASAFAGAIEANRLGVKTLMINAGLPLGGTCVNVGCVPSKALLSAAEVLNLASKNYLFSAKQKKDLNALFRRAVKRKDLIVSQARKEKYESVLASLSNVRFQEGFAEFVSKNEVRVKDKVFYGKNFLIATGSRAFVPEIEGLKEAGFLTHIEALSLKRLPKSILILGAGPQGIEFAKLFASFSVKVYLVELSDRILPYGERELTSRLSELLEKEGVKILNSAMLYKVEKKKGGKVAFVRLKNGKSVKIKVDEILLSASRKANTEKLNLKNAGVKTDKKGLVVVNKYLKSSQDNIYACGDVAALPKRLETTAGHEGTLAVRNLLLREKNFIDYNLVPFVIFSDPQYAGVGFSEEEYVRKYKVCACRTFSFSKLPKAQILGREEGLIKMTIDPKTERVVGVHILSKDASELIGQAVFLIKNKNTLDDIINQVGVFPALSEAYKYVALSFKNDISKLSCCI